MRILVVEDNDSAREGLCTLLKDAGYDVRAVANGIDALGALATRSWKPDLMLLDYTLGAFSGGDVIEAMHLIRELHPAPIFMVTANYTLPDEVQARVVRVFRKPLNVAELLEAIERFEPGK